MNTTAKRRSEARAMIAGTFLVLGILFAFQPNGLFIGLVLMFAGLGHALMGRRENAAAEQPADEPAHPAADG